jgi:hypothetical protein
VVTVLNASGALALLTGVTALRLREHDPDEIALPSS